VHYPQLLHRACLPARVARSCFIGGDDGDDRSGCFRCTPVAVENVHVSVSPFSAPRAVTRAWQEGEVLSLTALGYQADEQEPDAPWRSRLLPLGDERHTEEAHTK
jgi:hypothetical protein